VGHGFYGFRVLSLPRYLWFTGSPEIASPASSGLVGATHRRIGLHLPQLSRSHLSLSISRSPSQSLISHSLASLSHSISLTLSIALCGSLGRRTKKKRSKKKGRRRIEQKEEKMQSWTAVHREEKREKGKERKEKG